MEHFVVLGMQFIYIYLYYIYPILFLSISLSYLSALSYMYVPYYVLMSFNLFSVLNFAPNYTTILYTLFAFKQEKCERRKKQTKLNEQTKAKRRNNFLITENNLKIQEKSVFCAVEQYFLSLCNFFLTDTIYNLDE